MSDGQNRAQQGRIPTRQAEAADWWAHDAVRRDGSDPTLSAIMPDIDLPPLQEDEEPVPEDLWDPYTILESDDYSMFKVYSASKLSERDTSGTVSIRCSHILQSNIQSLVDQRVIPGINNTSDFWRDAGYQSMVKWSNHERFPTDIQAEMARTRKLMAFASKMDRVTQGRIANSTIIEGARIELDRCVDEGYRQGFRNLLANLKEQIELGTFESVQLETVNKIIEEAEFHLGRM